MSNQNQFYPEAYSVGQPLNQIFPLPIIAKRVPTTADKAQLGRLWVYPATNQAWVLTSIVANSATWEAISGGAGVFSSLTVNPGPTALSTVGNGAVSIGNATNTGAITLTVGTGNMAVVGGGNTISIGNDAAANTVVIGSTTAASTLTLDTPVGTPVVAANGLTATVGNLTASNGNVVLSTAATFVQLPGPIKIMSGAGAPANGLAAEAGDLYVRTDPAGATSRIYVATGAGAWTNVTCAA